MVKKNGIEMYSTHDNGKSVAAERFTRTLKNKINKCMTSISKNLYIDEFDDRVNEYNIHIIKMKSFDVKLNTYIDSSKETNDKNPKFKIADTVRISKYKIVFTKGYTSNCSEEFFAIKKVENTVPWAYSINDLKREVIIAMFYDNGLQKTIQTEFRIEKVIKRKGEELYVKWKGHDNLYKSWLHENYIE